nr:rootletin-like isoform X1 [Ipomoea batatas]
MGLQTVLEAQISQLQNERDSWLQKEAGYQGKISLLVDEAAALNLKRVRLEEKIKQMEEERDAWIQKEVNTNFSRCIWFLLQVGYQDGSFDVLMIVV